MQFFDKYLSYWPVLSASVLFLLLGLWLWLVSERAMERSPKTLDWVKEYRSPGFPFRAARLPFGRWSWTGLILVVLAAAAFQLFLRANTMRAIFARWSFPTLDRYDLLMLVLAAVGGAGVYFCVHLLFQSSFAAFWSALLFSLSPLASHGVVSLLAVVLLLAILYLRADKPGLPGELLYLAAAALLCTAVSACGPAVWLVPALIALHLYKLVWQRREDRIGLAKLFLMLLLALLVWAVFAAVAFCANLFIQTGYSFTVLRGLLRPELLLPLFRGFLERVGSSLLRMPRPGLLLNPLMDAPLLGLGLWGLVSALCMLAKRRSVRGTAAFAVALALGLVWLLSAAYLLPLALALLFGAMLKNADVGKRRGLASCVCAVGVAWNFALVTAAWWLPLTGELFLRVLRL